MILTLDNAEHRIFEPSNYDMDDIQVKNLSRVKINFN
jgi:hypothetical protein